MVAEGIFYAAHALVSLPETAGTDEASVPYCSNVAARNCVPVAPASINVVGEDGYWTLVDASELSRARPVTINQLAARADAPNVPEPRNLYVAPLPPMPVQFGIGAVLVLMIVAGTSRRDDPHQARIR